MCAPRDQGVRSVSFRKTNETRRAFRVARRDIWTNIVATVETPVRKFIRITRRFEK